MSKIIQVEFQPATWVGTCPAYPDLVVTDPDPIRLVQRMIEARPELACPDAINVGLDYDNYYTEDDYYEFEDKDN